MRVKICRKEAKESRLWLDLLDCEKNTACQNERLRLVQEAKELKLIFSAIVLKSS